jgi:hypothetical protein
MFDMGITSVPPNVSILTINEFVFDGFLYITLGAFGIASIDKYVTSKKKINEMTEQEEEG